MPIYRGVNGVNREILSQLRGVNGVNRNILRQYHGLNGVNRLVFSYNSGSPLFNSLSPFTGSSPYQVITPVRNSEGWRMTSGGFTDRNSICPLLTNNLVSIPLGATVKVRFKSNVSITSAPYTLGIIASDSRANDNNFGLLSYTSSIYSENEIFEFTWFNNVTPLTRYLGVQLQSPNTSDIVTFTLLDIELTN